MIDRRRLGELVWNALAIVALWLAVSVFSASEFYRRSIVVGDPPLWTNILVFQIMSSLVWAFTTPILIAVAERLPLRRPHFVRNAVLVVALIPVLAILRAVFGSIIDEIGENGQLTLGFTIRSLQIRFHRNTFFIAVIFGLTNAWLAYREAAARERRELELEAQLAREQVQQLRTRLQPQFLFAMLRSIAERVRTDPAEADRMLVGLSALLRASLDRRERPTVTLAEELEFVDRYLGLQDVALRVDVDDELLAAEVPPMFLQPLLDAVTGRGAVEIVARAEDDALQVELRAGGARVASTSVPLLRSAA